MMYKPVLWSMVTNSGSWRETSLKKTKQMKAMQSTNKQTKLNKKQIKLNKKQISAPEYYIDTGLALWTHNTDIVVAPFHIFF